MSANWDYHDWRVAAAAAATLVTDNVCIGVCATDPD
jgi:hypothetical protein